MIFNNTFLCPVCREGLACRLQRALAVWRSCDVIRRHTQHEPAVSHHIAAPVLQQQQYYKDASATRNNQNGEIDQAMQLNEVTCEGVKSSSLNFHADGTKKIQTLYCLPKQLELTDRHHAYQSSSKECSKSFGHTLNTGINISSIKKDLSNLQTRNLNSMDNLSRIKNRNSQRSLFSHKKRSISSSNGDFLLRVLQLGCHANQLPGNAIIAEVVEKNKDLKNNVDKDLSVLENPVRSEDQNVFGNGKSLRSLPIPYEKIVTSKTSMEAQNTILNNDVQNNLGKVTANVPNISTNMRHASFARDSFTNQLGSCNETVSSEDVVLVFFMQELALSPSVGQLLAVRPPW